jgi:hypothetical protein
MCRSTNRRGSVPEPAVYFRIIHVPLDGHNGGPVAAYGEQMVEIALGGPVDLLRKAIEWQTLLESIEITNQAETARRPQLTKRILRPIETIVESHDQLREFHKLFA